MKVSYALKLKHSTMECFLLSNYFLYLGVIHIFKTFFFVKGSSQFYDRNINSHPEYILGSAFCTMIDIHVFFLSNRTEIDSFLSVSVMSNFITTPEQG